MRKPLFILVALAPTIALAQHPGPLVTPIDHRFQPPVEIRRTSAEQPLSQSTKPPLRLAPRSDASRPNIRKPAQTTPASALTTVGGSLAVVLGLFLIVAWCTRKFSPTGSQVLPKEAIELLGRVSLAARQQAHLVRVGN